MKNSKNLLDIIHNCLDSNKAVDIVDISLKNKTDIADYMIIATGTSTRHVAALANHVQTAIKAATHHGTKIEGLDKCDWVLIDAGDVIVHLFREEIRDIYKLEKMWSDSLEGADAADTLVV